jgi:hypothetical protein
MTNGKKMALLLMLAVGAVVLLALLVSFHCPHRYRHYHHRHRCFCCCCHYFCSCSACATHVVVGPLGARNRRLLSTP